LKCTKNNDKLILFTPKYKSLKKKSLKIWKECNRNEIIKIRGVFGGGVEKIINISLNLKLFKIEIKIYNFWELKFSKPPLNSPLSSVQSKELSI
jgi:hypothetical protein